MNEWIDVNERLPKVEKTYLVKTGEATRVYHSDLKDKDMVFKISYHGSNLIVDNIAYSTIKLNYKKPWSIERSPGDWAKFGGRVTHWAYLPGEDAENGRAKSKS